jgi:hypothetical protein
MQYKKQSQRILGHSLAAALWLCFLPLQAEELTESPVPDAYVARAIFTTDIVDREPVDFLAIDCLLFVPNAGPGRSP